MKGNNTHKLVKIIMNDKSFLEYLWKLYIQYRNWRSLVKLKLTIINFLDYILHTKKLVKIKMQGKDEIKKQD